VQRRLPGSLLGGAAGLGGPDDDVLVGGGRAGEGVPVEGEGSAFVNAAISFIPLASALYFLVVLPINELHERLARTTMPRRPSGTSPNASVPFPPKPGTAPPAAPPVGRTRPGGGDEPARRVTGLHDVAPDHCGGVSPGRRDPAEPPGTSTSAR